MKSIVVLLVLQLGAGCAQSVVLARDDLPRLRGLATAEAVRVRDEGGGRVTVGRDTPLTLQIGDGPSVRVRPWQLGFGLESLRVEDPPGPTIPYERLTVRVPTRARHLAWIIPLAVGGVIIVGSFVLLAMYMSSSDWP